MFSKNEERVDTGMNNSQPFVNTGLQVGTELNATEMEAVGGGIFFVVAVIGLALLDSYIWYQVGKSS